MMPPTKRLACYTWLRSVTEAGLRSHEFPSRDLVKSPPPPRPALTRKASQAYKQVRP